MKQYEDLIEKVMTGVGILLGLAIIAGLIVTIFLGVQHHDDMTQREQTARQQQLVTACKASADPQTCLELIVSPNARIINNRDR